MTDSQAHSKVKSAPATARWTSGALADMLGATLLGPADIPLSRLSGLDDADERTLTFIRDARHAARWADSPARCAIVSRGAEPASHDPATRALLVVEDADQTLIRLLESVAPPHTPPPAGVHPSAAIDPTASIGADARIGPHTAVGPGVVVGPRAVLHAGVVLGAAARVGEDADIRAGVVIEDRCVVGARVTIHPNCVIGADGFGYRPGEHGPIKIPHAGDVVIGNDVEIGACTSIDRGKFGSTRIGDHVKIDNHVQIGHNCVIGSASMICGACALAGSVRIGEGATLGGGVGVKDNIAIGAGATIGARSGVMNDIPPGETWLGYPARPMRETMRIIAAEGKLPELVAEVSRLKRARGAPAQPASFAEPAS